MSISPEASVEQNDVPAQRRTNERSAVERAMRFLPAVREATERLDLVVAELDNAALRAPSLLPGWSRGHVVTHLARNADALVNLLTWARTGVEHPMYASSADRDADIEEGAERLARVLHEDLLAASARFLAAAEQLPESAWLTPVAGRTATLFPAANIPSFRLFEVWVHLVDLDTGFGFDDIPQEHLEKMIGVAVSRHVDRPDGPTVRLTVELSDGSEKVWDLTGGLDDRVHEVAGSAADAIAWLSGRGDGAGLRGDVPVLPAWG